MENFQLNLQLFQMALNLLNSNAQAKVEFLSKEQTIEVSDICCKILNKLNLQFNSPIKLVN